MIEREFRKLPFVFNNPQKGSGSLWAGMVPSFQVCHEHISPADKSSWPTKGPHQGESQEPQLEGGTFPVSVYWATVRISILSASTLLVSPLFWTQSHSSGNSRLIEMNCVSWRCYVLAMPAAAFITK